MENKNQNFKNVNKKFFKKIKILNKKIFKLKNKKIWKHFKKLLLFDVWYVTIIPEEVLERRKDWKRVLI